MAGKCQKHIFSHLHLPELVSEVIKVIISGLDVPLFMRVFPPNYAYCISCIFKQDKNRQVKGKHRKCIGSTLRLVF